ncbi:MAG: transposase, partial [Acidobacteria bacterium]|nr:transposase [Acidobacteriota bacterium]
LRSIYRIQGAIPCDNQMRGILDPLDPTPLRALYSALFHRLRCAGVVRQYQYWHDFVIVSVDGVEHFSSTTVHCAGCTTRTHRNGVVSYHHAALAAVMLHPDYREVFPLEFEPIVRQDGARKNDCERNASKRLGAALYERYPDLPILLVEDALHANAPHLRQITGYGWRYVVNVKPDSHTSLFKQFAGRHASGQVIELRRTDSAGVQHYFAWTNGLCLCESAVDVRVNLLWYEQTQPDGTLTRWTWITNWPLTKRTVEKVMRAGRGRWKIENETFNTLKNQGYHFTHNYGHGEQYLATVLAVLMLLAFLVDQIQQRCCQLFRQVWTGLGTKAKLWEMVRSLFRTQLFPSMTTLYRSLGYLYALQIE